jgi:GxxExxY protein
MTINDITYGIIGAAYKVHNALGPGLLERFYQAAMEIQLQEDGFKIIPQAPVPIVYHGHNLGDDCRIDILVNDSVIIELKSVETVAKVHEKQLLSYLKLTNLHIGLLINFNEPNLQNGIYRIINN